MDSEYKNHNKKKSAMWDVEETECFLAIIKELQVLTLMDGKKFRTSDIFKKVEEIFKSKGYNRTHTQLLEKFKAMKKRFKATTEALSVSGAGSKIKCPFFEELSEIFGHRPILNQSGIDSILPPDSNDETSGCCASDTKVFGIKLKSASQKENFVKHSNDCPSLSPSLTCHQRSPSPDALQHLFPSSLTSNCLSEDTSTSTSFSDSHELDNFDKLGTSFSKKLKPCKTSTYQRRESSRSGLKNVMQNFAQQIIESQENLVTKTIEEQRKLDKEMLDQYNNIFLQQTQMLLTGLQNISSPTHYSTSQQFVTTRPPMNSMFTETPLHQSYPMQPMFPYQNNNPYTSSWHETQAYPAESNKKSDQTKKAIPKLTIPSPNSTQPDTTPHKPLVPNPSTSPHTSQNETPRSVFQEDKDSSDNEYEYIEYLDDE